ncbi:hypothetical protein [Geobacter sulfurreducens]|uniref:hypothetical protein n=1 Tax=Geobacter sulfurreducens TaxID=35554 RepID=UPI0001D8F575|nr:hypothetical protein [Geobacter sulfurreducens]ADI83304.1 hypothetical protein KN400_0441 [Geobacter sulfurreducens KN400]
MASITQKNNRRYRLQFTMRRELYETYQTLLERASELRVVIDFAHDFEEWFFNQLEQVSHELGKLEAHSQRSSRPRPNDGQADLD